jgi:Type VI secretion system VasI, EvfG, VC_A0118
MKGVGALAVIVLSSLSQAVCAQAGDAIDRLKACSQVEGMERLKCVDELLGEMVEKPDSKQPQGVNWVISETTSPVDYRPQIAALTTARAPSSQDAPSSLAIHCRAQRTELIISTTGSWKQATDGEVKVVSRINEEPLVEQRWRPAEAGRSLAFQGDVVRFLRSIPDGGQFLVKVYAGKSPPYESTFKLAGLDPVRRKIAAACNWPQL